MGKLQQKKEGSYFLIIPRDLVKQRKWKKGQRLDLRFNERGNIEIFEIK